MKIFELLTERKIADLYHFTSVEGLMDIINSGFIKQGKDGWISLTRNPRYNITSDSEYGLLIIDQGKLSNTHKIEPYDFDQSKDNDDNEHSWARSPDQRRAEAEERTKRPIPLKYVKGIRLPKSYSPQVLKQEIEQYRKEEGPDADLPFSMTDNATAMLDTQLKLLNKLKQLNIDVRYY